jgi:predicted hydrocarbon binding protein
MEEERSINRQQFLRQAGVCFCGCAAILSSTTLLSQEIKQTQDLETPVDKKMQFAHKWVKRFFDIFDKELDEPTRQRILEENGKQCYMQGINQKYPPVSMEKFVEILQEGVGKENCWMERNTVYFNYVRDPRDLRKEDGYCLCPLVEDGPSDLSGTYCHCSVGYVREMFSSSTDQKVEVELLESVKRGGKRCRFKITVV